MLFLMKSFLSQKNVRPLSLDIGKVTLECASHQGKKTQQFKITQTKKR